MRLVLSMGAALAVALCGVQASAQTIGCTTGGVGGAFPTSGTGNGTFQTVLPSFPFSSVLNVASLPPGATVVTEVKLNTMNHTYAGDTHFVLTAPSGQLINLFCRQGGGNDWGGSYVINSVEQALALPAGTPVPSSTFSQNFGTWTSTNFGIDNVALSAVAAQTGNWTLTIYDWAGGDVGTLTDWDICFGTPPPVPPPSAAPALTAPAANANVTGLFVNLSWGAVLGATSYEVDVDGTVYATAGTAFQFQSTAGLHNWTARGVNSSGAGPWAVSRAFTDTGLTAPTLSAPAANAVVFGPVVPLSWTAVTGASSYDVDVDGIVYNTTSTSYAYNSAAGVHNWTVRAKWVNNTIVGPYAAVRSYTDLGAAPSPCNGTVLAAAPFVGGNGLGTNSCVYFDLNVTNPAGINVSQFLTNATGTAGVAFTLEVFTCPTTYLGNELNSAVWTLVSTGGGVGAGTGQQSLAEVPDFFLAQGAHGMALRIIGAGHTYTNGNGGNQFFSNSDLSITLGASQATMFVSTPFTPRVWNGSIVYNCNSTPPVLSYCTAGTTTNGCTADISASNQPSVTQANPCTISVADVEGQKSGLIFYSVSGQLIQAWNASSFLCVKAPTQRSNTQVSGGTVGQCNGTLSLDWNAFQNANPTALGNPFSAGNKVQVQAWFRDPPAGKATNLSNAIELTYVP
jgi:subtilisin-like proprotein convertase family protein